MQINSKKFSLLVAEASAVVYIVCSAFVALFPDLSTRLMTSLFHISGNLTVGARVTLVGVIIGTVQVAIYSYVIGRIFAWVFNKSMAK